MSSRPKTRFFRLLTGNGGTISAFGPLGPGKVEFLMGLFSKMFGTRSEREVKKLEPLVKSVMREIERIVTLRVVDEYWMDNIDAMDDLRQGIRLRAYAQDDPVVAYKREGFEMFEAMPRSRPATSICTTARCGCRPTSISARSSVRAAVSTTAVSPTTRWRACASARSPTTATTTTSTSGSASAAI